MHELHGPEGYSVASPLEAGRFFVVFRVARGAESFVCKRPAARFASDDAAASLLRTEAEALSRLGGSCAPALVATGEDRRGPYLVTTVAPGRTLAALGRATADEVALAHVLLALARVHGAGVAHGDLSPSNVLVCGSEVTLIDFALARFPSAPDSRPPAASASFRGTVLYAAPEHARGEPATFASDVFGAAASLLHVVTGRPPRRAGSLAAGLLEAAEEPISQPLVAALKEAAPTLGPWLARALAMDPEVRPRAEDLAGAATLLLREHLRGSRGP